MKKQVFLKCRIPQDDAIWIQFKLVIIILGFILNLNKKIRLKSDYFFNVTFYEKLPTKIKLGKIFIVFPS